MEGFTEACTMAAEAGLGLRETPAGLVLTDGEMELSCDLSRMAPRLAQGALSHELLVRAARVRGAEAPCAVDATAGFGEDSLLLAAAGFAVELFECNPVIAVLLQDGLERAARIPELAGAVSRMHVHVGDSIQGLETLASAGARPDVVYLDPMFPGRTKSAAVKKKFQLLHRLERPCADEEALARAALAAATRKVVVKRPIKGPFLAGLKPSSQLKGKAVRYDILIPPTR